MNIIAFDVASEVSAYCILKKNGKIATQDCVITRIGDLKSVIKQVPRPRQVIFEECAQAAWLWSELRSVCDDVVVCDPRQNRAKIGQFKSDKKDALMLAKLAYTKEFKRVWHGGRELQNLKEAVRTYQTLTEQSTRCKNQLRAVFRSCGIAVGQKAYNEKSRKLLIESLPLIAQRDRVESIGKILDLVTEQRTKASRSMVKYSRKQSGYKALRKIDGIGPVFSSMFLSEIGDPFRFRTRQQIWSFSGLAITTDESSEFEVKNNQIKRKSRAVKTRGLVRSYNRIMKYIAKQAAMNLSRNAWKSQYQQILKNSKNEKNAQLTLARKIICVMWHIAKTGEEYDVGKVFKKH